MSNKFLCLDLIQKSLGLQRILYTYCVKYNYLASRPGDIPAPPPRSVITPPVTRALWRPPHLSFNKPKSQFIKADILGIGREELKSLPKNLHNKTWIISQGILEYLCLGSPEIVIFVLKEKYENTILFQQNLCRSLQINWLLNADNGKCGFDFLSICIVIKSG